MAVGSLVFKASASGSYRVLSSIPDTVLKMLCMQSLCTINLWVRKSCGWSRCSLQCGYRFLEITSLPFRVWQICGGGDRQCLSYEAEVGLLPFMGLSFSGAAPPLSRIRMVLGYSQVVYDNNKYGSWKAAHRALTTSSFGITVCLPQE